MNVTPKYLKELEKLLEQTLNPEFLEIKRLHNGIVSLKVVSKEFSSEMDPFRYLQSLLQEHKLELPKGILTSLYAPEDLDEEERAALQEPFRGTPTWADALHRDPRENPNDSRPELKDKLVVAFWGVKGGVGRTTALAHVAAILSRRGENVLAVDLDLDSPALIARLCSQEEANRARFDSLLDVFHRDQDPNTLRNALLDVLVVNRDERDFRLHLLGQGFADAKFVTALTGSLTPAALYRNKPLLREIIAMAANLTSADIILIDARSGFCEKSAACLFDLADEVFLFVSPSPSNFRSLQPAIEAMERCRLNLGHPKAIHFVASMLPSGQDALNAVKVELNEVITRSYEELKQACQLDASQLPVESPLVDIHYIPGIVENEGSLFTEKVEGYSEIAERICLTPTITLKPKMD